MKLPLPHKDKIIQVSNFETLYNYSDNLKLTQRVALIESLSWISKFAFDNDYLSFCYDRFLLPEKLSKNKIKKETASTLAEYEKTFKSEKGCKTFTDKYPLLPHLKQNYLDSVDRYIGVIKQHYSQDQAELSKLLNEDIPLGDIVDIELGLGDMHQHGKSTAIIHFSTGNKLVYKPRSGGLDEAYYSFLEKVNSNISKVNLKTTKVYCKKDYFWMEFLEHLPCDKLEDVNSYYFNAGVLMAIINLLRGADMHYENIIANGKHPVIIDVEFLFNLQNISQYSVIHTGMIPLNSYVNDNIGSFDNSGFGANGKQQTSTKVWKWKNVDSDALNLERDLGFILPGKNQPIFEGNRIPPSDYLKKILEGYDCFSEWILKEKESFKVSNPFEVFKNKSIRIAPRSTQTYRNILENSYIPESLASKTVRKSYIKKYLNQFPLQLPLSKDEKEQIIKYECEAIERMDIPYFTANTSDKFLMESDSLVLKKYYNVSPYDFVMDKIQSLDQEEINQQLAIIKSAFVVRYNLNAEQLSFTFSEKKRKYFNCSNSIVKEASLIAENIVEQAQNYEGQFIWNSLVTKGDNTICFDVLEDGLFSGTLGIVFFLSAIAKFENSSRYDQIIDSIISEQIRRVVNDKNEATLLKSDLSFSTGMSGIIYTLLKVNPVKYKNEAIELTQLITKELIVKDQKIDTLAGSAGCLVVLVGLYKESNSDVVLKKIKLIADNLLDKRIYDELTGSYVWITGNTKKALTGFSHGVSGIAYGLLKAFEVTGYEKYKEAFYEAVDYEDYHYNKKEKNWLDLRSEEKTFKTMWCHGAPGIGLSRLYAYEILKDERFLKDVENAVDAVKLFPLNSMDFYCCGNVGRLDFLLEAARVLKDNKLHKFVKQKIEDLIELKSNNGFYQTHHLPDVSIENPSLFRGVSGIGYTLLRTIDSVNFPCFGLLQ